MYELTFPTAGHSGWGCAKQGHSGIKCGPSEDLALWGWEDVDPYLAVTK